MAEEGEKEVAGVEAAVLYASLCSMAHPHHYLQTPSRQQHSRSFWHLPGSHSSVGPSEYLHQVDTKSQSAAPT